MLHKWACQLRKEGELVQRYQLQKWISALLLSSVEGTVDRKLIIEHDNPGKGREALLVRNSKSSMESSFAHFLLALDLHRRSKLLQFRPLGRTTRSYTYYEDLLETDEPIFFSAREQFCFTGSTQPSARTFRLSTALSKGLQRSPARFRRDVRRLEYRPPGTVFVRGCWYRDQAECVR